MNKKWLYVFTRKDLSASQIAVQSIHSAYEMGRFFKEGERHPSVVLIKLKNEKELLKLENYLKKIDLNFKSFVEPYYNHSLTSISVEPISSEQRHLFKKYQLMKDSDFNNYNAIDKINEISKKLQDKSPSFNTQSILEDLRNIKENR